MEDTFLRSLKKFSREHTPELSIIGLIFGSLLTIIGINGVFLPTYHIPYIENFLAFIGFWDYWIFIIAIILTFASAWFLYSNIQDRKTFFDLIDTGSKATFVRNQDELEEIAFRLGSEYQDILYDKKKELKIK